jgi:hypothetical protein
VIGALRSLAGLSEVGEQLAPPPSTRIEHQAVAREVVRFTEQPCPMCQSSRLHRSKARSLPERVRRNFSARRLFRCDDCNWRGWLMPLEFADAESAPQAPAPDLTVLDEAVQSLRMPLRRSFSPRDLQ